VYAENVLHQARVLVDEALRRENAVQSIEAEIQEEHFSNIDLGLSRVGNLDEQLNIIYTEFPALGLRSCYLSLLDDQLAHPDRARLILAYEDHRRIDLPARGISFSAKELIPASLFPVDRRHNFVVKALAHRDKNLGFILMEMGDNVQFAGIFDYLCPKLTSVLQLAIFIEKTVRQAEDLDRANKQLGETNQALEEFAFMASHDLQEPLRKILVFGDRLAGTGKDVLTEQGKDYLARMENAAVRMQTLIDSLLSYSRVSTTNNPFSTMDLNQVIKGVLSDLDATIEATHARVETADLPAINADPVQMNQLFQNLIGNAIKFQPPGAQPLVKIYREPGGTEGEFAIVVEDNGIGIEKKYHEKIFVVFQRLHTHQQYEGNGIGLAICKKIAERHNATISVESEPGRGTKFILRFRGKSRLTTDELRRIPENTDKHR
jgi:signal transduction histidine kinase